MAARSVAWVCGLSLAGIAASNPAVTFAANRNISLEPRERGGGKHCVERILCLPDKFLF